MQLDSLSDVKLIGRALTQGWLAGHEERKRAAINALFDVVENSVDEEMKIKAFTALVKADQADLKRKEVEIKKQAIDDAKRFRLLELVRNLPAGELAKLAPGDAGVADAG
jgi:hypothetical protein